MLAWVIVAAMLLAGVTVSRSRAGLGLAVLGMLVFLYWAWRTRDAHPGAWRWLSAFFAFAVLIAFQAGFLAIEDRLGQFSDNRFVTTPVFFDLATHFAWLGSGAGTFPVAYAAHEPLEVLGSRLLNHAHNDWVELWVEFGILVVPVLVAFLWWLQRHLLALWRSGGKADPVQCAAGLILVLLLLHSLVDYPLRTTAMSVVFALACATLVAWPEDLRRR
jgi:O-antigen ligase